MNDFLTEKNKKAGVLGKLKWVLKFRKHYGRKKPGKLPAGLNLMPRIRSHLRNLSRNWEKAQ